MLLVIRKKLFYEIISNKEVDKIFNIYLISLINSNCILFNLNIKKKIY